MDEPIAPISRILSGLREAGEAIIYLEYASPRTSLRLRPRP